MPFKINISHKGKTLKKETENEALIGKKLGETISGGEVGAELSGYELEITGTSDKAGFPGKKDIEGSSLKKVLLKKGFAMHNKRKGIRKKKTVRGNTISKETVQINTIVKKLGSQKFEELLPKKEAKEKKEEGKKPEERVEEQKEEGKEKVEVKEERREEKPEEKLAESP